MLGNFGKFTLIEKLAEGGMAEVFRATTTATDGSARALAIKRLHRALCEDADLTQMLVDEARIAVKLNHPNIAQVFDLGCIDNQYFMTMEYVDGPDLQHLLEKGRRVAQYVPIPAAIFIVSETLAALQYAHTRTDGSGQPMGIVHRDVSPQNIMVTFDGQVKLVDFGIAKARNRVQTTQHGIIKGKFFYMAPEQAHAHHVDPRTDVYAAGMVLYELLAGRSPYQDVHDAELLRHVRRAQFPPPHAYRQDLDPLLADIVMQAVERNPELRFRDAMAFRLALLDYSERHFPGYGRRQLAQFVNAFADVRRSNDNFDPMVRGAYHATTESMLFEWPESVVLESQDLEIVNDGSNKRNPFSDNEPTEIYEKPEYPPAPGPPRQLPPSPGQQPPPPRQQAVVGSATTTGGPAHARASAPSPASATRSIIDRFARPIYVYIAIAVALVLVLTLAVVWYFSGGAGGEEGEGEMATAVASADPEAMARQGADGVRVAVTSEPEGAEIFVDGEKQGTTPSELSFAPGKTYELELVKDGFEVTRKSFEVENKGGQELSIPLEQARGILKIVSFPPDAVITIDGEEQGKTPVVLTGLETDQEYEVVAKLGDHEESQAVAWAGDDQPIKEVMFEFEDAPSAEQFSLAIDKSKIESGEKAEPEKPARKRYRRAKKRTRRRPARRRSRPKKEEPQEEEVEESLDIFGGSDSKKAAKKKPEKEEESGEGFSIWGDSKSSSSKKKKKPAPKKKEEKEESLDIW